MYKKIIIAKAVVTTALIILASVTISTTMANDSKEVTQDETDCLKLEARHLFDNPLEAIIIQSLEVEKNEEGKKLVNVYTLGGLKYAVAEVTCNKGAQVIWRRWFGK